MHYDQDFFGKSSLSTRISHYYFLQIINLIQTHAYLHNYTYMYSCIIMCISSRIQMLTGKYYCCHSLQRVPKKPVGPLFRKVRRGMRLLAASFLFFYSLYLFNGVLSLFLDLICKGTSDFLRNSFRFFESF